jgi:steroid delta-isomerase-like uncharacterized protein
MSLDTEANKAIVARHFAVLNGGDPADWDEIMADDFVPHHPSASGSGRDRYRDSFAAYPTVFSDLSFDVHRVVAENDCVVAQFTVRGRHTGSFGGYVGTGREFAVDNIAIFRVANAQMVEAWYLEDTLGWFQQIGLLPTNVTAFRQFWENVAPGDVSGST